MNIFVDVDGTVADLNVGWLGRYNRDYDDHLTAEDIKDWGIQKYVKPECGVKIFDYLEDPTLYDDVPPLPGALDGVITLRKLGHRVIFATSGPNGSAGRKLRWLLEHGFLYSTDLKGSVHPDYIEINDKSLLRGDVLIDDGPHNIKAFQGFGILMGAHHNRGFDYPYRAKVWEDVIRFMTQDVLPVGNHPVEIKSPYQARGFKEITDQMYQLHLKKNQDYSPANILGTGYIGLVTRLWDKMARLLNLAGFKITIVASEFTAPSEPKNESIDDTLLDMANYAVIGYLLRKGWWGR